VSNLTVENCEPCFLLGDEDTAAPFRAGTDFTPVCFWHIDHPWTEKPAQPQAKVTKEVRVRRATAIVVAAARRAVTDPGLRHLHQEALHDLRQAIADLDDLGA
jgi:hypothetical protein